MNILGDFEGRCTSFQHNGLSVIDYCLVDRQLYDYVMYFNVHDVTHISDHVPISVCLNITNFPNEKPGKTIGYSKCHAKFMWDEASYVEALKLQKYQEKTVALCMNMYKNNTMALCMNMYKNNTEGINSLCSDVSAILFDAAKLSLKKCKPQSSTGSKPKSAKWYSKDLCTLNNEVLHLHTGKLLSRFPKDPIIRGISKKKVYKQACRKAQLQYMNDIGLQLDTTEITNPQPMRTALV